MALAVDQAVNGQPDWSMLLASVARLRGDDVVLKSCGLDAAAETIREKPPEKVADKTTPVASPAPMTLPARAIVRLQGYGRSQAAVGQFVLRLEQTGLFDDVLLVKTNREPFLDDHAMSFQLECQLKSGAIEPKPALRPKRLAGVDTAGSLP